MNKKRWGLLARIIVGVALLSYLFHKVDIAHVWEGLRGVQPRYLIPAFVLILFGNLIGSIRWKVLLRAKGIEVPVRKLFSFYLVGFFFNMFLPTSVGGDVARAVDLSRHTRRTADSLSSILVERVLGLMALSIMACLSMGLFFHLNPNFGLLVLTLSVTALLGFILFAFFFWTALNKKLRAILRRISYRNLGERIDHGLASILSYRQSPFSLAAAILISFLYQISAFVAGYILSISLGMELSVIYFFIFMPIITVISMIPISLYAIGVRETAFVYCFKWAGVPESQALALSLLFFSLLVLLSIMGGVVYSFRGFFSGESGTGEPETDSPATSAE